MARFHTQFKVRIPLIFNYVLIRTNFTNPHWARVVGYGPFFLWVIHVHGVINRLMMMTKHKRPL
jgi:hypothetical protein